MTTYIHPNAWDGKTEVELTDAGDSVVLTILESKDRFPATVVDVFLSLQQTYELWRQLGGLIASVELQNDERVRQARYTEEMNREEVAE